MFKKLNKTIKNVKSPVQYDIEKYKNILNQINKINLKSLSDDNLKQMSKKLMKDSKRGVCLDKLLVESFALVREASRRVVRMYHYDVQVIAGIVMHEGKIAEMKTGEGKTLAAVMPAYLNALSGKGVHILTFNDYLAKRDANWMGPIYEFLGLTVGYINEGMSLEERKKAYSCDVTYITAKEAGFDYLRDFLCTHKNELVHNSFKFAIVDEVDSILIDESRIPLVIAGEFPEEEQNLIDLSRIVKSLNLNKDYELDEYEKNITLTDNGLIHLEEILGIDNLYDSENLNILTRLNCALHAEFLLEKDRDYIVRNGKVEIVDDFTGRIADKRHWPDNLQCAVEAKEGLEYKSKGKIMGSIPLQYFLNLYDKISGMTGTAYEGAVELKEFYCLDVVIIPTNKPCIRKDYGDTMYSNKNAKNKALISAIKKVHETGQPILIGTGSVEESEKLSDELIKIGIKCNVLNAKNDEMEAKIISKAGEFKTVTVSTNMAGRGIDIKLGGVDEKDREKVVSLGGLYVIGTNHHESIRIDNQLRGRAGRQGDPGESRFFISLEDDLIKKYALKKMIPSNSYSENQVEPIENLIVKREIERGQRIVQGYNYDIRKQLWKYTYMIEQQRRIIHEKRQNILMDKEKLDILVTNSFEHYNLLVNKLLKRL